MDAQVDLGLPFDLNEDQRAIQDMVLGFAREKVAPFAVEWDQASHLPLDVIKETASPNTTPKAISKSLRAR